MVGWGWRRGSPTVVSRSQMEQLWPWFPASPSMFSGKTRIMSLERVSTPPPMRALCPCFAQSPVMGEEPLDLRVGLCLLFHPEKPFTRWPYSWALAGPRGPGEGAPDEG